MKIFSNVKRLLINVDMVNGFVNEGPMHDSYINHIVPMQIRLMEAYESDEEGVIAIVKDTHREGCREFNRYPVHCLENTYESELIDDLKRFETMDACIFRKNSTSTIYAKGFLEMIENLPSLEEVVIVGCCTDICILNLAIPLQNYFDEMNKNVTITIPKNGVETYDSPTHKRYEYNDMAFKMLSQAGINIVEVM